MTFEVGSVQFVAKTTIFAPLPLCHLLCLLRLRVSMKQGKSRGDRGTLATGEVAGGGKKTVPSGEFPARKGVSCGGDEATFSNHPVERFRASGFASQQWSMLFGLSNYRVRKSVLILFFFFFFIILY